MGESKPLASLTSGLLARKGGARPAMRRQPLGSGPAGQGANGYDDLGWNDMGYDVDPEQSSHELPRSDIKSMLSGSMPAHNVEAEQAVDLGHVAEDFGAEFAALPWADQARFDEPRDKPEIVKQQEVLHAQFEAELPEPVSVEPASVEPEYEPEFVPAFAAPVLSVKPARRPAAPRQRAAVSAREKAAFTLRLDAERHLRLRLASAIYNRSAQQILIDVLDEYLSALPEIDAMASRLPTTPSQRKSAQTNVGDDQ